LHPDHQLGPVERDFEEELQAGDRVVQRHGRCAVVDQIELVAAQVLDGGRVRRAPEKTGELTHDVQVDVLRLGGKLAHAHIVDHALAQWAGVCR